MKISASLFSNKTVPLQELVQQLDQCGTDYFHLDCAEDPEVIDKIPLIRSVSQTPLDVHLITSDPTPYLPALAKYGVEMLCYQYENLASVASIPDSFPGKQGLAITSHTPVEVFEKVQDRCSFVLFMTTVPGESGGTFDRTNFQRIHRFRQMFPEARIHVDGGVNAEVSFILRNMGVSAAVSGSYLLNGTSIPEAMLRLVRDHTQSAYQVRDFMLDMSQTPLLKEEEASLATALGVIEHFKHGLALVSDQNMRLTGIITNADIRKGMLKHLKDLNRIPLSDILNPDPITAFEDQTVEELLHLIRSSSIPINYLPVLNHHRQVVGLLTFRDLVKGE